MAALHGLYRKLPYPLRVAAATARGWQLRRWRTAERSARLVAEALERDAWDAKVWETWTAARSAELLDHAARTVPYYREQWTARRRSGDTRSWEVLAHWPVLPKSALRARPEAFLSDADHRAGLQLLHTSGTTGTPLRLWRSRAASVEWYALVTARVQRWNGVEPEDRWAVLGGQLVADVASTKPPFWVWNAAMHQLYLSSYHLSPQTIPAYAEALRSHRIRCVEGYPSSLHSVAMEALRAGLALPQMRVAVSNAEPLSQRQRGAIERAFGAPVRDTYGMTEIAAGASECAHGALHLWPDAGIVETLDADGAPVAPGVPGRMICTGLLNRAMPLIRYEVGDSGTLAAGGRRCACGRGLPVLAAVEGRLDDVIRTRDGRRIGRLDPVFKDDIPIAEAQIVQESLDRIHVRYVPGDGFSSEHERALARRLAERLGTIEIEFEPVAAIARSANGKFRAVVSKLPREGES